MANPDSTTDILFAETQRFNQVWLWIPLLGLNGLALFALVSQVVLKHHPFGDRPLPDAGIIILTLILLLLSGLFFSFRLETRIKKDGIYVRFTPFESAFKRYPWSGIRQSFIRQYRPMAEYGGWGIRVAGKNKAYNVSGNQGIQLILEDGSKVLIGTRRAKAVEEVLRQLGCLHPPNQLTFAGNDSSPK